MITPKAGSDDKAELRERLRARTADVATLSNAEIDACLSYLELLTVWNRRINLTALPLHAPVPDQTLEKLIVEPLRAASWITDGSKWADLGSGGGSPAIPLKIGRRSADLHLIESRERKCAFLRNALRSLELTPATVHCARLEQLVAAGPSSGVFGLDIVTVRAVRVDVDLLEDLTQCLRSGGRLVVFGERPPAHQRFELESMADGLVVLKMS